MNRTWLLYASQLLILTGLGTRARAQHPVSAPPHGGAAPVLTAALQMPMTPDFTLTLSQQAMTVTRGQTATLTVQSSDLNGFDSPINLSCSGMPTGTTCAFAPATLDPSASATLTVTAATMVSPYSSPTGMGMMGAAIGGLGLMGFVFSGRLQTQGNARRGAVCWRASSIALLLGLAVFGVACGYSSKNTPTAVGTKSVMVMGTSGTLSHTAPFSLTVM